MTATMVPAARPRPVTRGSARSAVRLLSLELRHNAMPLLLPLVAVLFWVTTYRKAMAQPPLWSLRATTLQTGALLTFVGPVTGAAAWMASRDGRRRTSELVAITARPRWARLLTAWAATTCWALAGYLACVAVLYGMTAGQGPAAGRCGGRPWSAPRACRRSPRSGSPPEQRCLAGSPRRWPRSPRSSCSR